MISCAVELLGFLNKTCDAGTNPASASAGATAGPVLRGAKDGRRWKQWIFQVLNKANGPGDASTVSLSNYNPPSGPSPR